MHLEILRTIEQTHRHYVQRVHTFRDRALDEAFGRMLANEGNLTRGPFLEVLPSYELAERTAEAFQRAIGAPIDPATLKSICKHAKLYWHQAEAVRRVFDDRNCLIASGTGSGKTEAFLYPILLHLYREALDGTLSRPGVRALIIYPMNALSNDQLDRLASISEALQANGSRFMFSYGQYTGETPEDEKDTARDAQTKSRNRRRGEAVFRSEMQRSPPHILLTNYSMLEYLLLRPEDSPLFDGDHGEPWRFIVVDEVHTYNGTKGTEIAFLLRRLKQRLREGGRKKRFTCIATSATVIGGDRDRIDAASFASDLFGETFEEEDILLGRPVGIPAIEELPEQVSGDEERLNESRALLGDSRFRRFLTLAMEQPQDVATLASRNAVDPSTIETWATQLTGLVHPLSGDPLTTVRYHLFLRTLPGLYTSFYPNKDVALAPRKDSGGGWFFTTLCRRCGQHYLTGQIDASNRLLEPLENPLEEDAQTLYFLPVEAPDPATAYWSINPLTQEIRSPVQGPGTGPGWEHKMSVELQEVSEGSTTGNLSTCSICGYSSREPVRSPRLQILEPQSLVSLALHRAMPRDRAKILTFCDGRQDAARFAVAAQDFADDAIMRSFLYGVFRSDDEVTHTLEDLAIRIATRMNKLNSADYRGKKAHAAAYRFLLREAMNRTDTASFLNTGLMMASFRLPESVRMPERWASEYHLTDAEGRELLSRLLDSTLDDNAVNLNRLDVDVAYWLLALAAPQQSLVCGDVGGRPKVKSWDSPNSRRGYLVEEALLEKGVTLSPDGVRLVLQEALDVLRRALDDCGEPLLLTAADGDQVDARSLQFTFLRGKYRLCGYCRTTRLPGPFVACTKTRCRGRFTEVDQTAKARDPFLDVYSADVKDRFRIEEHTAQLSKTIARLYQEQFKQGRIHALSSSTTFELGVDLGDLDAVFLRNVPPESFNYTQRVGRVGRRKGFPGIVIVFARQRSHDFYHYANPLNMLQGKIRPPRISLSNERIFLRHAVAAVLSKFFRQYPASIESVSAFVEIEPDGILERLAGFVEEHEEELAIHLVSAFGDAAALRESLAKRHWVGWTCGKASALEKAQQEYTDELALLVNLEQTASQPQRADYRTAQWAKERQQTIKLERVLTFLSRKSVIPKYGFPVDVVELDTQPTRRGGQDSPVELQRDLSLAITEYAPGAEVVADKKAWRSVAVKRVQHRQWPRMNFRACEVHGIYREHLDATALKGPTCCKRMLQGQYIIPEYGFLTRPHAEGHRPTGVSRFTSSSIPFFAGVSGADEWKEFADGRIKVSTASPGDMVILASSGKRNPYHLCEKCGLSLSVGKKRQADAEDKHLPPNLSKDASNAYSCYGVALQAHLAHKFRTTVLRVAFPRLSITSKADPREVAVFYEGLGTAVTESAADILQVPGNEIGYTLTGQADGGSSLMVVLFDKAPGGAGLVEQLGDARLLYETLEVALHRTGGSCGCADDSSCYSCLRTYRNQDYHPFLRRGEVHQALGELLANFGGRSGTEGGATTFAKS